MKLQQAEQIAKLWVNRLAPYCERIEIAGGVRRQKAEPHDIEIVCIPKITEWKDLFGEPGDRVSELEHILSNFVVADLCKPVKNGPKYKQLALPEGINLDLFIVRPETWAVQFTIRTGPADFSHRCVTPRRHSGWLPSDCQVRDGQVWRRGKPLAFSGEMEFLYFLGLGWIEPKDRR